jgi:uncharacterized lipoprotein
MQKVSNAREKHGDSMLVCRGDYDRVKPLAIERLNQAGDNVVSSWRSLAQTAATDASASVKTARKRGANETELNAKSVERP